MDYSGHTNLDPSRWDHTIGLVEITLLNKDIFRQMFTDDTNARETCHYQRYVLSVSDQDAKIFIGENYDLETPKVIIRESQGSKYGLLSATTWYPVEKKFVNYRFGVLYVRKMGVMHYALVGLDNSLKGTREELLELDRFDSLWGALKWLFKVSNLLDILITKKEYDEVLFLKSTGELRKYKGARDPQLAKREGDLLNRSLVDVPEEILREVAWETSGKNFVGGFGDLAIVHRHRSIWFPYKINFVLNEKYQELFIGIRVKRNLWGKRRWRLLCLNMTAGSVEEYKSAKDLVARKLPQHYLLNIIEYDLWKSKVSLF